MLLTLQKIALFLCFWAALLIAPPVLAGSKDGIIYEYDLITQKKGQSFQSALAKAKLSAYQTELMMKLPVLREAKSDRIFRVSYLIKSNKRLMREVKVTRGNRMANFVLTGAPGSHKFVSKPSEIKAKQLRPSARAKTASQSAKTLKPLKNHNESLFSLTVTQKKGEKLERALRPLKLSTTQKNIVNSGKFTKSALGDRRLTFYFAGSPAKKLLRGVTIKRGNRRVDFMVSKVGKHFLLRNLRVVGEKQRKEMLTKFAGAQHKGHYSSTSGTNTGKKTTAKSPKKSAKKSKGKIVNSGGYRLYRIRQAKGQSLNAAMKGFLLTAAQRDLLRKIPVVKRAKSTRYFYPLFEKKGSKKYLKAVRIARGGNVAEFVLVKYRGKWVWADRRGKIKTRGGFLRYPLNFRRISSGFNLRRRHPITRRIRPHKGTDFSARHGTPIWAPANGVVTFAGRQRGYGITLEIDHGNGYKTLYAHLSRIVKGIRKGKRVKKRQVIARVGNTGRSTASHLHYEVKVNGRPRNPMTVRLPGGGGSKTLPSAKKAANHYLPKIRQML